MLKDTILKFLKLDTLIDHLTGFVETRIALMKVEIQEEIARVLSKAMVFLVVVAVLTLFVLLFSIAVSYEIAKHVGMFGGFAIVAGFYLLLGLLVIVFRSEISEKLENKLQDIMKRTKK